MRVGHFFIDRPIFATVLSIIIVLVGALSYFNLAIEQYPQIVPPTIQVSADYPGADAQTVAETVATPLEQEINGVEDMLYMSSQSTEDGHLVITVTFKIGTNLDQAQVLVQNRVAIAEPRLPEEVRRIGITTVKNSPDLMLVINLFSPNGEYDQTYIGNYAVLHIMDQIKRINGVGNIRMSGASEYAIRIWLNPDLMNSFNISANEVLSALRAQNMQVASGGLNRPPQEHQLGLEYNIQTQGRLIKKEDFENIIVKSSDIGRIVRLKDIGRAELGTQDYLTKGYLNTYQAVALPVFQRPGTNAIETSNEIQATMRQLAKDFPPGMAYKIAYNPTIFVEESITAVKYTIFEAIFLVVLVILLFLQSWRAALIPVIAIPVSLIGTFAAMEVFNFSLNYLTLFGLVLAIGVVVDDAIVVVENMERNLETGMDAHTAAKKTMDEVGTALVAIGLVLVAVFLPTIFLQGLSGLFYQQFGATVAVATILSVFVSITLSPSLAALLLKPKNNHAAKTITWKHPIRSFNYGFTKLMTNSSKAYSKLVGKLTRRSWLMVLIYAILILITIVLFKIIPTGFIPPQDKGYFIVSVQLPPSASLARTDKVVKLAARKLLAIPGVENVVSFSGFAGATFTNSSNSGALFAVLEPFDQRLAKGLEFNQILSQMRASMNEIKQASIVVIPPPPVRGIGNAGGFKMMVQDRSGRGLDVLQKGANALIEKANQAPATTAVFTLFENNSPRLYLDIDRQKAERLRVKIANITDALELYLGSIFVNEFNFLGRTFRVIAQADAAFRSTPDDVLRLRVRNEGGQMVPIGSVAKIKYKVGTSRLPRYNLYPAIEIFGDVKPGFSTGEALTTMEELATRYLPNGLGYEWTELAYQEKTVGNTGIIAFSLSVIFVFLVLSALYESWLLPFAVILIVPMCLLSSLIGLKLWGMDNNIMTQIGFIILIGLACKNAILIVEFARKLEEEGANRWKAAITAARLRLRPILMTSFAFILGVFPLVIATGAGAEMRRALGVAVFSGMLGVTFFGLLFTPVFYILISQLSHWRRN